MVDTARCLRHVPDDPDCGASLPSSPTLNETSLTIVAASSSMADPALLVPWGILGSGFYTRSLAFATRMLVRYALDRPGHCAPLDSNDLRRYKRALGYAGFSSLVTRLHVPSSRSGRCGCTLPCSAGSSPAATTMSGSRCSSARSGWHRRATDERSHAASADRRMWYGYSANQPEGRALTEYTGI